MILEFKFSKKKYEQYQDEIRKLCPTFDMAVTEGDTVCVQFFVSISDDWNILKQLACDLEIPVSVDRRLIESTRCTVRK